MSFKSFFIFTSAILVLMLLPGSLSLRDVAMIIPEAVERGNPITIGCIYDLENENLTDIKLYKGSKKLWQYTPKEVPPFKVFPSSGLEVDIKNSDSKQLTIKAATSKAQGRYTCLVVVDMLNYAVKMEGYMYVVDLPKSYPDLIWKQRRIYRPGMKIKAKCVSYDSIPPANLSFYINNVPALPKHVTKTVRRSHSSLWTAYSTLKFVVQKHHIAETQISIRCTATIYSLYYKSYEEVARAEIIRTTIASNIWGQKTTTTTAYPKHYISESSVSWNQKKLWFVFSIALIVYGEQSVE